MPPFSAVSKSRALLFCKDTWAKEVICLYKEARESAIESSATCNFVSKSLMAHRVCPRAPPENAILYTDAIRETPTIIGKKTVLVLRALGSNHYNSALPYKVSCGTTMTIKQGPVKFGGM